MHTMIYLYITRLTPLPRRVWTSVFLMLIMLCASCGSGGNVPANGVGIKRPLATSVLQARTIAYSPYRTADRNTETITDAMIEQDLRLLVQAGFGVIRLFDASDAVAKKTLEVITAQSLPLKVMLGMYVNPNAEAATRPSWTGALPWPRHIRVPWCL